MPRPQAPKIVASPSRFLDVALKKVGPQSLCYVHGDLKWVIRKHILDLVHDHPSLSPSADDFTYDDGSTAYLLKVSGVLPLKQLARLFPSPAEIHVTIWLHPRYPTDPPSVSVLLCPNTSAFDGQTPPAPVHPFVDSTTGAVTTPYLLKWGDPSSSSSTPHLSELVRNLIKIFNYWPPFPFIASPTATAPYTLPFVMAPTTGIEPQDTDAAASMDIAMVASALHNNNTHRTSGKSPATTSMASPREAADRLTMALLHNLYLLTAAVQEDEAGFGAAQARLRARAAALARIASIHDKDLDQLNQQVQRVNAHVNGLEEWLKHMGKSQFPEDAPEEAFLPEDDESGRKLEDRSGFDAIDDVINRLDRAAEAKVIPAVLYLQQVRALAREQAYFAHREAAKTPFWNGLHPTGFAQQQSRH